MSVFQDFFLYTKQWLITNENWLSPLGVLVGISASILAGFKYLKKRKSKLPNYNLNEHEELVGTNKELVEAFKSNILERIIVIEKHLQTIKNVDKSYTANSIINKTNENQNQKNNYSKLQNTESKLINFDRYPNANRDFEIARTQNAIEGSEKFYQFSKEYEKQFDFVNAIIYMEMAIKLNPLNPRFFYEMGWYYYEEGFNTEAKDTFLKANKLASIYGNEKWIIDESMKMVAALEIKLFENLEEARRLMSIGIELFSENKIAKAFEYFSYSRIIYIKWTDEKNAERVECESWYNNSKQLYESKLID